PCCQQLSLSCEDAGAFACRSPRCCTHGFVGSAAWECGEDRVSPLVDQLDDALAAGELRVEVLMLSWCEAEGAGDLAALGGAGEVHHDLRADVCFEEWVEELDAGARDDHADAVLAHQRLHVGEQWLPVDV